MQPIVLSKVCILYNADFRAGMQQDSARVPQLLVRLCQRPHLGLLLQIHSFR